MICKIIGGYMLAKTLVVFYVWSPDIFVFIFYHNPFSGIVYSIMSNKTLPYHTIPYLGAFPDQLLCLLYRAPSDHLFAYYYYMYMGPSQISFFAYYIEAPSDQLYRLLYGGPSDQFFHLLMGPPPQVSFCAYYMGPPQMSFCAYYIVHVYGSPSGQFICLL